MSKNTKIDILFMVMAISILLWKQYQNLSWWWLIGLIVIYVSVTVYGCLNIAWSYFCDVRSSGDVGDTRIALTFDDGPVDQKTQKILVILNDYKIPATFFCIGDRVDKMPHMVQELDKHGHLIGNHSYFHKSSFPLQRTKDLVNELRSTDKRILDVIGKQPKFFRPPFGITNPRIANAVNETNHHVIGWNIRSFDTISKDPEALLARIVKKVRGGDIILLHDYSDVMIQVLPTLIQQLTAKGYSFVRVDVLLNENAYA